MNSLFPLAMMTVVFPSLCCWYSPKGQEGHIVVSLIFTFSFAANTGKCHEDIGLFANNTNEAEDGEAAVEVSYPPASQRQYESKGPYIIGCCLTPNISNGTLSPTMTCSGSRRIRGVVSRSSPSLSWPMNFEILISKRCATSFSRTTKSSIMWVLLCARS